MERVPVFNIGTRIPHNIFHHLMGKVALVYGTLSISFMYLFCCYDYLREFVGLVFQASFLAVQ